MSPEVLMGFLGAGPQEDALRQAFAEADDRGVALRRGLDPAVALVAAARGCGLLIVQQPASPAAAALVAAVSRRARCPVVVVSDRAP